MSGRSLCFSLSHLISNSILNIKGLSYILFKQHIPVERLSDSTQTFSDQKKYLVRQRGCLTAILGQGKLMPLFKLVGCAIRIKHLCIIM